MSNQGLKRSDGSEREEHDFYATHPNAVIPLMSLLNLDDVGVNCEPKLIWENSCGQGHLSVMLQAYGHKVISTDLIDRGFGTYDVDFLKPSMYDDFPFDMIVMNPPYKHAEAFVRKSIKVAPIVCAFLRLTFLESKGRKKLFKKYPPKTVAVFSERIQSSKNAKFVKPCGKKEASTVAYAWFIWQRGFEGDPTIKWI